MFQMYNDNVYLAHLGHVEIEKHIKHTLNQINNYSKLKFILYLNIASYPNDTKIMSMSLIYLHKLYVY